MKRSNTLNNHSGLKMQPPITAMSHRSLTHPEREGFLRQLSRPHNAAERRESYP
jgi:hypothetical protein